MLARVPKGTEDLNRQALAAGVAAAQEGGAVSVPDEPGKARQWSGARSRRSPGKNLRRSKEAWG